MTKSNVTGIKGGKSKAKSLEQEMEETIPAMLKDYAETIKAFKPMMEAHARKTELECKKLELEIAVLQYVEANRK